MKFSQFLHTDLKAFSIYANVRTIPSIVDGLKVPQRKALYGVKHHGGQTTVARLASHAAEVTSYIHGEENMQDTIVNLAQDFPGTNNVPLLAKAGQFGTALDKGASEARYSKASLHKANFSRYFSEADEPILKFLYQEEQFVEPEYYLPSLPLVLINGASGMGVGYATNILQHAEKDVLRAVDEVMKTGKVQTPLVPSLTGYKGQITRNPETDQITIHGCVKVVDRTTILITEVPPKWDRKKYRDFLNKLRQKDFSKDMKWVRSYTNESGEDSGGWHITVKVPMAVTQLPKDKLLEAFGLVERNTQNIVLWDTKGQLRTFPNAEAVVEEFVPFRLAKYQERKDSMLEAMEDEVDWNDLRIRFIRYWNENTATLVKLSKKEWQSLLTEELKCTAEQCDKLLDMNIHSLTKERLEALVNANQKLYSSYQQLERTAPSQIWVEDLKKIK